MLDPEKTGVYYSDQYETGYIRDTCSRQYHQKQSHAVFESFEI